MKTRSLPGGQLKALLHKVGVLSYAQALRASLRRTRQSARMRFFPSATMHPHRLVFIAGLPKSGTTWLENLVAAVPGYHTLVPYDPQHLLPEHILDPGLLTHVPARGNFILKTHMEGRPQGVEALRNHGIPTVVMVRDLRDQCVSRYYHVLSSPEHRPHDFYRSSDQSVGISHCLEVSVTEYADWVRNWMPVLAEDDSGLFMLVRYEDLLADTKGMFSKVLEHFATAIPEHEVDAIIEEVARAAREGADLEERLRKGNTFRSGQVGEWREHFSPEDIERFKAAANDVLVSLAYEKDDTWQAR